MCLKDLMTKLQEQGFRVTETRLRWAIRTGKVSRPALDGSLRYVYEPRHLEELLAYFGNRAETVAVCQ
jgi:hypothetical protein